MKIVFFSDSYFPVINGVSAAVDAYAAGLRRLGHKVLIVTAANSGVKAGEKDVVRLTSIKSAIPDVRFSLPSRKIQQRIVDFKPDIFHTHSPFSVGAMGLMLGKLMKIPVVATHHTNFSDPEITKELPFLGSMLKGRSIKVVKMVLQKYLQAHKLITVPTKDTLSDLVSMGIPTDRIRVIPVPILDESLHQSKNAGLELRRKYGIGRAILFAGRLSRVKRIDEVIQVFALVKQRLADMRLVIIGDGFDKERLKKVAVDLGVAADVMWTGKIEHEALVSQGYYYLGDVFLTMSRFETQGVSTVEAMACGLVATGAAARGTCDVLTGAGLLFEQTMSLEEIADRLVELFESPTEMSGYKKMGDERVLDYSLDRVAGELEAFYHQALRGTI